MTTQAFVAEPPTYSISTVEPFKQIRFAVLVTCAAGLLFFVTKDFTLAIGLALIPIALSYPAYTVLLFSTFSLFRLHETIPGLAALNPTFGLGVLAVIAFCWHCFIVRSTSLALNSEMKLFVIFFLIVSLSVVFARVHQPAIDFWSTYYWKVGVITIAVASLCTTARHLSVASNLFVVAGIIVSSIAIANWYAGVSLVEGSRVGLGANSQIGDPNDLALILLFPLSFAAAQVIARPSKSALFLGAIAMPILVWSILITQSRGGLIGMGSVLVVLMWKTFRSKVLLIALLVAGAALIYQMSGVGDRSLDLAGDQSLDTSAMSWLYLWQAAIKMSLLHPILGVGPNVFPELLYAYTDRWVGFQNFVAHSSWFTALAETGILGGGIFIVMVARSWASAHRAVDYLQHAAGARSKYATALALMAGHAGFFAAGTFLTQTYSWQVSIMVALTAALARQSAEQSNSQV